MERQITQTGSHLRYGCHECREDAELVLSGRATVQLRDHYELHLKACGDCRRVHRILLAIYEGPAAGPASSAGVASDHEFSAIMRRCRDEQTNPWYQRMSVRAGVVSLSAAAAGLALALMGVAPFGAATSDAPLTASAESQPGDPEHLDTGGIDHPAQSFGRVVGGHAQITFPDARSASGSTLPVGASFQVPLNESLQVALAGKVVANFTPGTELTWVEASPKLIEVQLDRGLVAMRYDRRPADPILQVRTPTAVVRVVGTVFTVQVDSEGGTAVSVLRGEVEVVDPADNRAVASVEAGYRFDMNNSTFADVGKDEVAAALPLSNDHQILADGQVPNDWVVPGLAPEGEQRTLAWVPRHRTAPLASPEPVRRLSPAPAPAGAARLADDDGGDLIAELMRDAERTRRAEVRGTLERCRTLYEDTNERYRAANCLSRFIKRHGNDPLAVEGFLLVGMLRMDYALDYKAADAAFQQFLDRSPGHPRAELAMYRLWLSSTENGRIADALDRGRNYLERYPNGRYVGKILQRFPELKSAL